MWESIKLKKGKKGTAWPKELKNGQQSMTWWAGTGERKGLRAMLERCVAHHFLISLTSPAVHLPRQPPLGVRNSSTPDLLTPAAQQIPSPCPHTRTFQIPKSQLTSWTLTPHLLRWRLPLGLAEGLLSLLCGSWCLTVSAVPNSFPSS